MGLLCCDTLCASMLSCLSWVYFVVTHCVLSCCHVSHGFTCSCDTLWASMLSCFSWGYFVVAHCVLPWCHVCHGVTLLRLTVCFDAAMLLMGLLCCGSLYAFMLSCVSWGYCLMKAKCNWCFHWGYFCFGSENVHGTIHGGGNMQMVYTRIKHHSGIADGGIHAINSISWTYKRICKYW